jgi:integrase/recombinase XerC
MNLHVQRTDEGHVLAGDGPDVVLVNGFLAHLSTRNSAAATRRAYCFDLLNVLRFLTGRGLSLVEVRPLDLFDYRTGRRSRGGRRPGRW